MLKKSAFTGSLEASQNLEVNFANALTLSQFSASLTCNGQTIFVGFYMPGTKTVQVAANQKTPGASCDLNITAPVTQDVQFTVDPAPIPTPLRVVTKAQEPYRYGVLEHPFPFSLGDMTCSVYDCASGTATMKADSEQQSQYICASGAGYIRIDYTAQQIETVNGLGKANLTTPNFTIEDAIVNRMHACGVTELPDFLQYAAGPVNSGGKGQSAFMVDPAFYAKFVGDSVTHLKQFPWITKIQLMNEPNDHGWGTCPTGGSATPWATSDESGKCAAAYLKAGYAAAKAANPAIVVVAPALSDGGQHTDFRKFLQTLLANGCGPGTCYDELDVHNYAWYSPLFSPGTENEFSDYTMAEAIVPGVPIMLTEWGYSQDDTNVGNQYILSEVAAAQYMGLAFNLMLSDPNIVGITYVNLYNTGTDFWGRTSLIAPDGTKKPGYTVFCTFTGAC